MSARRARFERWFLSKFPNGDLSRIGNGMYKHDMVQLRWETWDGCEETLARLEQEEAQR